jgi:DeoR/GlpR family transcriptional regulator of sugar metabolism
MIAQAATVVLVASARKFAGRGLNVIVPARQVQMAYLADPPATGARMLAEAGIEIFRV